MKEASRIQAAIEILEEVLKDTFPADSLLEQYFKSRRYIGAKDRRFIAELVWHVIRHRCQYTEMLHNYVSARLLIALNLIKAGSDIELLFNGEMYAPDLLAKKEKNILKEASLFESFSASALYECPDWLYCKFSDQNLLAALNKQAPVDVRANLTSREEAQRDLQKEGLFFSFTPYSPIGLRSEERINLKNCMTYQDGKIEVMDEGSQLLAQLCQAKPHHKIIDYCAGAGGKSLAIASLMHNDGVIWAHDINAERLFRIKKRAERLDILNIKPIKDVTDFDYDRFIIDAPCSGSGTWRRAPDAKFRLTPAKLQNICQTQADLLNFGAQHTKIGGYLIYMTCSVFAEENEQQIEKFLQQKTNFQLINHQKLWEDTLDLKFFPFDTSKWLKFSPLTTLTDGFFFCCLKKLS